MKITLLTGFLGSGKTTALKRLLRESVSSEKVGVIVSDLSELEVDGELIRNDDIVSESNGTLASFTGGSLDEHHRDIFLATLSKMRHRGLDHIMIEASGSADPKAIIDMLSTSPDIRQGVVATLVDARALQHDFAFGRTLLGNDAHEPTSNHLLRRQLKVADVIALSKSDLVEIQHMEMILRNLHQINPGASLTACTYGKLDRQLLSGCSRSFRKSSPGSFAPLTPESCDIGNTVIRDPRPFHPQRFYDLYQYRLGMGVYRTKGFLWFASRPADVLLWNQAGGAMGLEWLATWRAAILEGEDGHTLLPEEKEYLKKALLGTHPLFGDRGNELTVIGTAKDRTVFCRELEECFCTDEEVEYWRQGGVFPDPWPNRIREVS